MGYDKRFFDNLEDRFGIHLSIGDRSFLRRYLPFVNGDATDYDALQATGYHPNPHSPREKLPIVENGVTIIKQEAIYAKNNTEALLYQPIFSPGFKQLFSTSTNRFYL